MGATNDRQDGINRDKPESHGFVRLGDILRQMMAHGLPGQTDIHTGFQDLDMLLGGLQRSSLVVLGALNGMGKSALATNIAVNVARGGGAVGIFDLGMNRQQLAIRLLAAEAGVDAQRISLGLYTEAEEALIVKAVGELRGMRLYTDHPPLTNIVDIHDTSREIAGQDRLDLLVVDYLQAIRSQQGMLSGSNRAQEIGSITRALRGICAELDVPIIVCSQLSRSVSNRPERRPVLTDLRDSGSIEEDADIVLFIHREDALYSEEDWDKVFPGHPYPRGAAEIIVAKNRHGPTGSVMLRFRDNCMRFESRET